MGEYLGQQGVAGAAMLAAGAGALVGVLATVAAFVGLILSVWRGISEYQYSLRSDEAIPIALFVIAGIVCLGAALVGASLRRRP
ncbi:MAG TPA: hypothetical protein VKT77_01465 [Chthonomonadaceae bacterium]|nr:hypothetical protein [Chthonomonadaceae bacterium]